MLYLRKSTSGGLSFFALDANHMIKTRSFLINLNAPSYLVPATLIENIKLHFTRLFSLTQVEWESVEFISSLLNFQCNQSPHNLKKSWARWTGQSLLKSKPTFCHYFKLIKWNVQPVCNTLCNAIQAHPIYILCHLSLNQLAHCIIITCICAMRI